MCYTLGRLEDNFFLRKCEMSKILTEALNKTISYQLTKGGSGCSHNKWVRTLKVSKGNVYKCTKCDARRTVLNK